MNSNNSNHSDGSYHEYLDGKPRTKDGKLIEEKKAKEVKEEKKEVKNDKTKDRK